MRTFKMKSTSGTSTRLSRRAFVGTAVAGAGFLALPRSLRAGTGDEAPIRALAFDGDALLVARQTLSRSEDSAASWTSESAPDVGDILALTTHPDRPGRVIAGMTTGGVAISDDGGRSWEARSGGLPGEAVIAVTVAAAQPDTLYAAIRGDGLWQSEDAGRSWAFAMDRPWLGQAERDPMALASINLATGMGGIWIYAGTDVGLTRVPDCFCRWQDVQPDDAMEALASGAEAAPEAPLPAGEPIQALASAPSAPETLYAALPSGIWASQDAGVAWFRVTAGQAVAAAVHPTDANHLVAAIDGGLMQSRDGGTTWTALAAEWWRSP